MVWFWEVVGAYSNELKLRLLQVSQPPMVCLVISVSLVMSLFCIVLLVCDGDI